MKYLLICLSLVSFSTLECKDKIWPTMQDLRPYKGSRNMLWKLDRKDIKKSVLVAHQRIIFLENLLNSIQWEECRHEEEATYRLRYQLEQAIEETQSLRHILGTFYLEDRDDT